MEIAMPEPKMSDYERANFATEVAFNVLTKQAKTLGLPMLSVMGLLYLPTQELTRNFQEACHAILLALTPKETHIIQDGQESFSTEIL